MADRTGHSLRVSHKERRKILWRAGREGKTENTPPQKKKERSDGRKMQDDGNRSGNAVMPACEF